MVLAWTMMFSGSIAPGGSTRPVAIKIEEAEKARPPMNNSAVPPPKAYSNASALDSFESLDLELNQTDTNRFVTEWNKMFQLQRQFDERKNIFLLGFCFALIAIGFSLFVMGIEGVADVGGSAKEIGALSLKVSSPGLFCILLAAILVALGINGGWNAPGSPTATETKADVVRAEGQAQEGVARAEAD